jgi:phosphoserine phosphatase
VRTWRAPRYATVVLDVDSTLCGVEGIDWLARLREPAVAAEIARLTDRAMDGAVPLDRVYGERLTLVRPTRAEIVWLGEIYRATLAPGAAEAIARLRRAGVRVVLVSGGLRESILPVASDLGIATADVHAVGIHFDGAGGFVGHTATSPLTTATGKRLVVESLVLPRPVLGVGDGATDLAMRPAVDAFAAFTGFARREAVVRGADHELTAFHQLPELVLG